MVILAGSVTVVSFGRDPLINSAVGSRRKISGEPGNPTDAAQADFAHSPPSAPPVPSRSGTDRDRERRRDGYRDPESQALIESWFGKLKERLIWRSEFETLDEARDAIGAFIER